MIVKTAALIVQIAMSHGAMPNASTEAELLAKQTIQIQLIAVHGLMQGSVLLTKTAMQLAQRLYETSVYLWGIAAFALGSATLSLGPLILKCWRRLTNDPPLPSKHTFIHS